MRQACSRSCKVIHSWVARLFHELDSIRSMLVTWVTRLASRSPNNKLVRHQRSTNILLSALERIPLPPRSNPSPPRTMERGGLTRMTYVRIYVKMNKAPRNVIGLFPRPRTKNLLERENTRREYLFHGVTARDRSVKKAGFSQARFRLRQTERGVVSVLDVCCISGHYGKII